LHERKKVGKFDPSMVNPTRYSQGETAEMRENEENLIT
jgi:hypothetical protein